MWRDSTSAMTILAVCTIAVVAFAGVSASRAEPAWDWHWLPIPPFEMTYEVWYAPTWHEDSGPPDKVRHLSFHNSGHWRLGTSAEALKRSKPALLPLGNGALVEPDTDLIVTQIAGRTRFVQPEGDLLPKSVLRSWAGQGAWRIEEFVDGEIIRATRIDRYSTGQSREFIYLPDFELPVEVREVSSEGTWTHFKVTSLVVDGKKLR